MVQRLGHTNGVRDGREGPRSEAARGLWTVDCGLWTDFQILGASPFISTSWTVNAGDKNAVSASAGGDLYEMALQVLGPIALQPYMPEIDLGSSAYFLDAANREMLLSSHLSPLIPSLFVIPDAPQEAQSPAALPAAPRRDGVKNFFTGFGAGLGDAGMSLVDGVKSLGKGAWYTVKNYNTISLAYRWIVHGNPILVEDQKRLKIAWNAAQVIGGVIYKINKDEANFFNAALTGDIQELNALGEEYKKVGEYCAELLQEAAVTLAGMDDYQIGRLEGRLVGEILAFVVTEGAGELTALGKVAWLEKLLPRLEQVPALTPILSGINKVKEYTNGLKSTKMCFVAGTIVHGPDRPMAIEDLRPGDFVLSRDENTGLQRHKRVVDTFKTHPSRLYHVCYSGPTGIEETVACTGEHPFYVEQRKIFVPAKELVVGDHLALTESAIATVTSVITEDAAAGSTFTTYNVEVEDFHTYFVGHAGVWVHNIGAVCEKLYSLFEHVRTGENLDRWDAFRRVMEETKMIQPEVDVALPDFANEVFAKIYADAAGDVNKVPTAKEVYEAMGAVWNPNAFGGKGGWVGSRHALVDMQNHHTAVTEWTQKLIGRKLSQAELDDMPALLLQRVDHTGKHGSGAFHAILDVIMRDHPPQSSADILHNLQQAYSDWDSTEGPAVWNVAKAWLQSKGVQ